MKPNLRTTCWTLCLVALTGLTVEAKDQVSDQRANREGEVTGEKVYVRSGPSLNHYPIDRLEAGDRVAIVGESGDWYEIVPPEGVFSFISGDYVDTADDKTGVVNGSQVRVRAGSTLPEFNKLKYVVQTKLAKGAEVTILARDPDGFLRIKPPAGTTVWINRAYVEYVPDVPVPAEPKPADASDAAGDGLQAEAGDTPVAGAPTDGGPAGDSADTARSQLSRLPPTEQRRELGRIDSAARAEVAKPVHERQFAPLIERYRSVVEQDEDSFARQYAQARIGQLAQMQVLVETVRKMQQLNEEAGVKRRAFLEGRAKIRETLPPIPDELEAQGELRVSALYPPGSLPRRYRLVDSAGGRERTVGYVEIPQDSSITVETFLGRYVGVRAAAQRLQTGGVDPVPIYVAGELVLLQPTTTEKSGE